MFASGQAKSFRPRLALIAGCASMLTVLTLIVIKTIAFVSSGSTSVLASLIDSGVDAAISLMTLLAINYSLKPADHDHRYGHGKVEALSALFQAALMSGAGIFLLFESLRRMTAPHEMSNNTTVLVIMGVSVLLSILLIMIQKYSLRHAPSLAVEADYAHYASDVLINGGVFIVVLMQICGGPAWLDPAFALLVSLWLLRTVYVIGFKGVDMLLDRELPDEIRDRIKSIIKSHPGIHDYHDLRTRMSGMYLHVSLDVEIDPQISLAEAHKISKELEIRILREFPNSEIMIHKDPIGDTDDSRHTVKGVHH